MGEREPRRITRKPCQVEFNEIFTLILRLSGFFHVGSADLIVLVSTIKIGAKCSLKSGGVSLKLRRVLGLCLNDSSGRFSLT